MPLVRTFDRFVTFTESGAAAGREPGKTDYEPLGSIGN